MEDQHPHDLYFPWPDLVDPFPEEIYLLWRDLVGKPDLEEIYFSWEDIMGDEYLKQDSDLQTPLWTNLASFKNGSYKSSADSDAGDSQWDDTESSLSLGLHSAAGSCSTNTSKRAHETWDNYTEEGQLPPYSFLPVDPCSVETPSIAAFSPRPFSSPALYGQIGTDDHDLETGKFLTEGSCPFLPPSKTVVLPNQTSPLKTGSISAITLQQPLPISFPSYPTNPLSAGSVDTDLSLEGTSDNQSLDSQDSDNDTTPGKERCGKLDANVSSEKIVTDVLNPTRMALVDRVMEEFWVMFNQGWSFNFTEHANTSSGTSRSSNVSDTNHDTGARQPSRRKRQREEENPGDQSGDRNSRTPGKRSSGGKDSEESIKFACPFRKHNPRKYNIYSHRTCTLSHWETIARPKHGAPNILISKFGKLT